MIRLQCYPANELSLEAHLQDASPLLSCVLHSGTLPPQHSLAVWVGGVSQPITTEGEIETSAWQCAAEVEMEIHLCQARRTVKAWRGWWKEERIVYGGTLALQVMLLGQMQPALHAQAHLRSAPLPLTGTVDQRNGTSALHAPHVEATALAVLDTPMRQLTNLSDEAGEEPGDLWDVELAATRKEAQSGEALEIQVDNENPVKENARGTFKQKLPEPSQIIPQDIEQDAIGPTIAALRMPFNSPSLAEQERLLERLATVLASMPANTVLVDLRKHPSARAAASRRAHARPGPVLGLTKELLRALYGARYWERGGAIPMTLHQGSTHPARWHIIIGDPQAEALKELCAQLAQGGSLLLLDSLAPYEGSVRAAVITFLHARFSQIIVGACS